jgi:diketogulonate reductase-like aldo/keto reductase
LDSRTLTRRSFCAALTAAPVAATLPFAALGKPEPATMLERTLGKTSTRLPVIGMGSSNTFDVGPADAERAPLLEVLQELHTAGGTVIDTSPMYGRSEAVLGDLIEKLRLRPQLWVATKVWTQGREAGARQIATSMGSLHVEQLDLLQIHNLLDWREHLPTLRDLRAAGKVRHIGITHYRADAHDELERVLAAEPFDSVQLNYSLAEPEAERRLLPFCQERGIGVIVNRPFADGAMFARARDKPLPASAAELGIESWAQYFLKWIAGHPAVTCVIPATASARHMRDNARAGFGPMPDARQRARMAADW